MLSVCFVTVILACRLSRELNQWWRLECLWLKCKVDDILPPPTFLHWLCWELKSPAPPSCRRTLERIGLFCLPANSYKFSWSRRCWWLGMNMWSSHSTIMMMAEPGKMQLFCDKSAIIITKVSAIAKMIILKHLCSALWLQYVFTELCVPLGVPFV